MTDELRKQVEQLRAIAPRLNAATDDAARTIVEVEKFLESLSIGIPADSGAFAQRTEFGQSEDERRVYTSLAYERVGGKFRLSVSEETFRADEWGQWTEKIGRDVTPWSSCPREVKLASFAQLPALLGNLAYNAAKLSDEAAATTATVRDLLGAIAPTTVGTPPAK